MDTLFFHPKLVHIPLALGILMPLISGAVILAWWRKYLPARSWGLVIALQAILLASGVGALRSGQAEEERVERFVAEERIEAHEEAAEAFVWASGAVLALMGLAAFLSTGRLGLPLAAASALGTVLVFALGYRVGERGGALVYEDGAAQAYVQRSTGGPANPPQEPANRDRDRDDDD